MSASRRRSIGYRFCKGFSLGACIYQAITHHLIEEAPARIAGEDMQPKLSGSEYEKQYSHAFLAAVDYALNVRAENCFQSAMDMQQGLLGQAELPPTPAPPPPHRLPPPPKPPTTAQLPCTAHPSSLPRRPPPAARRPRCAGEKQTAAVGRHRRGRGADCRACRIPVCRQRQRSRRTRAASRLRRPSLARCQRPHRTAPRQQQRRRTARATAARPTALPPKWQK